MNFLHKTATYMKNTKYINELKTNVYMKKNTPHLYRASVTLIHLILTETLLFKLSSTSASPMLPQVVCVQSSSFLNQNFIGAPNSTSLPILGNGCGFFDDNSTVNVFGIISSRPGTTLDSRLPQRSNFQMKNFSAFSWKFLILRSIDEIRGSWGVKSSSGKGRLEFAGSPERRLDMTRWS